MKRLLILVNDRRYRDKLPGVAQWTELIADVLEIGRNSAATQDCGCRNTVNFNSYTYKYCSFHPQLYRRSGNARLGAG